MIDILLAPPVPSAIYMVLVAILLDSGAVLAGPDQNIGS